MVLEHRKSSCVQVHIGPLLLLLGNGVTPQEGERQVASSAST